VKKVRLHVCTESVHVVVRKCVKMVSRRTNDVSPNTTRETFIDNKYTRVFFHRFVADWDTRGGQTPVDTESE
jgi:hypothetical protein